MHSLTPTPARRSRDRSLADVIRDPSSGDRGALLTADVPLAHRSSADAAGRLARDSGVPATAARVGEEIEKVASNSGSVLRRPWKGFLAAGMTAVALLLILAVVYNRVGPSGRLPDSVVESGPPPQLAQPPAQTAAKGAGSNPDRADGSATIEQHVNSIRAAARRLIALGQRQQALDSVTAGLVLDAADPELQRLLEELKRTARQNAVQERQAASRRGATEDSSIEFRDGLAREREADVLDRAGDRAPAIRSLWAAAGLYDRAARVGEQSTAAPAPGPKPAPDGERTEVPPAPPERPVLPSAAPLEALKTPPGAVERTPPAPVERKIEPPTAPLGNAEPDARTVDTAAVRETLRRYAEAYQSREIAAIREVLPSLSSQQLRSLERDFSNYRSYSVEIAGPRLAVEGVTATVTCDVTRSFVTKSGIAGGNTVATIFHLRKVAGSWIIEKLESR